MNTLQRRPFNSMKMKIKDSGNIVMNLPGSMCSGPEEYWPNEYNMNH